MTDLTLLDLIGSLLKLIPVTVIGVTGGILAGVLIFKHNKNKEVYEYLVRSIKHFFWKDAEECEQERKNKKK